ncbi:hypothetical protein E3N88_33669 [Mikania micrantha]|uniref:Replication factor A C-terminal domain-containing protein n=1 Tax=Mikania micrantha TaxID=192012 RepID=A0A5N6MEH3_9ASTR|nr:hypothetical protein E3N88_33669 [Mikania micrantha]
MQHIRLSEIKKQQRPIPLQIRVIKRWILTGTRQEICYLFVDKHQGDGIEVTADIDQKDYFESIIEVQSCYTVSKYVVIGNRSFMPVLKHEASLKIGKKAIFEPLLADDIPDHFFQFASYDELDNRMTLPKQLTDFIGIVEKNYQWTTNTGKTLRKINLKDIRLVQITLWPDKRHLVGDNVVRGDILAVTSTMVTEYDALKQLESTYSTEIFVNPTFTDVQEHVCRLKEIISDIIEPAAENIITLHDLLDNIPTAGKPKFTCIARIKEIQAYRSWFYVQCSICNTKMYLEIGDTSYYVCKDHEDMTPKFMYCMNAIIVDEIATTNAVFFNDVMTDLLGVTCDDMVNLHGHDDPKIPPPHMLSKIGVPMMFNLAIKPDRSIIVNKATEISMPTPTTTNLTPQTPDPKSLAIKRQMAKKTGKYTKL